MKNFTIKNVIKYLAAILAGFIIFLLFISIYPLPTNNLVSNAFPYPSINAANFGLELLKEKDTSTVNEACKTKAMVRPEKTEKVIVLIHGLYNCPAQFEEFGKQLFDQGYNVIIPRMPRNGLKDIKTDDLKNLTLTELTEFTDEVVDIASGFGDELIIAGISSGAVLAAHAANKREEVDKVVLISPFLEMANVPEFVSYMGMNFFNRVPNIRGQDILPFSNERPDYAYQGHTTKGLAKYLLIGENIQEQSKTSKPKTGEIIFVINEADKTVSNQSIKNLKENWQKQGQQNIEEITFSQNLNLPHDIIDPNQPNQNIEEVYPRLLDVI
jgi:carboxylesterase